MNSRDLLSLSIRNLLRRKTRTLLAVAGVVVGTCAIVVMLSIGFGLSVSFQAQIESYGNLHLVDVYQGGGMMMSGGGGMISESGGGTGKPAVLNDKAVLEIEKIPGVDAASPKEETFVTLAIGKHIAPVNIVGIRPEVMQKFKYDLKDGRLLQPGDKFSMVFGNQVPSFFYNPKKAQGVNWSGEAQVDVISDKIMLTGDQMYGQKRPQGEGGETEKINYKEYKAKGVGVLANEMDDSSYRVYMPLETVKTIKADTAKATKDNSARNRAGYESVMVYVGDIEDVEEVSEAIRQMGFQPSSLNDWLKSMQDTASMIQGILGGIGAISLLVAALGITNTMIMSIYERTKEIGVMKVIGANLVDIKKMFLTEAAFIGLIGGLMGLAISYILSLLMNTVLKGIMSTALGGIGGGGDGSIISIIPWWVAVGAVAFATVIGVVSGYYPANRAMKLSALESLRNE